MTITEIVLTAAEFQTLIDTLDAGIKHLKDKKNSPDAQRHRGDNTHRYLEENGCVECILYASLYGV